MDQKSFVEGARAFLLWGAQMIDQSHRGGDAAAEGLVSLLTPVIKGFLTDEGYDMTVLAQQVYGGHGYIEEWGMSQFTRDARIAMIYEGANGVQALDLVGRKLPEGMGRLMRRFFHPIDAFLQENMGNSEMAEFVMPLAKAFARLQSATADLGPKMMANADEAGAASTDYLRCVALVALAHMWAQIARKAQVKLAEGGDINTAFYENKLATGRFFMARILPDVHAHAAKAASGAANLMSVDAEAFEVA
jgi:hypothetical protein